MRLLSLALVAVVALTSSGCATLFTGTSDTISFDSEPDGAEILIDGIVQGRTPATIKVKRPGLGDTMVTMRLDGYDPVTFTLSDEFNAVSILNLAGIIGWGVDILTGAVMKYDKRAYDVDMSRGSVALNLDELPVDADGGYVVPADGGSVSVMDYQTGLEYVFE